MRVESWAVHMVYRIASVNGRDEDGVIQVKDEGDGKFE